MEQFIIKLSSEVKSLQQVAGLNQGNGYSQKVTNLQNGYSELQKKYKTLNQELMQVKNNNSNLNQELTRVKIEHSDLNKRNEILQSDIYKCGNDTMKLKTGLETFTHVISGWVLNNITQIESNVKSLENKMDKTNVQLNVLASNSNYGSSNILTLLNQTKDTQHKMTILDTKTKQNLLNYQTSTNNKIIAMENYLQGYQNSIDQKITTMATDMHSSQNNTNQKIVTMGTDFQSYQSSTYKLINGALHKIAPVNQTVILTSCGSGVESYSSGSVMKFSGTSKPVYGISDLSAFRSSGMFTCEIPGVYLFSVFILKGTYHSQYQMYKNNHIVSVFNSNSGTSTGIMGIL